MAGVAFGDRVISQSTGHPSPPSLSPLDPARHLSMGVIKVEALSLWSAGPGRAEARHQEGGQRHQARNVWQNFPWRMRHGKFYQTLRSEQSCATQRACLSGTCCSGRVVERGGTGPVAKKSPKNVLWDDIIILRLWSRLLILLNIEMWYIFNFHPV